MKKRVLSIIAMIIGTIMSVQSQEYSVDLTPYTDQGAIVRSVDSSSYMVLSNSYNIGTFILHEPGMVNTPIMHLRGPFCVNDFRVHQSWVYFCGSKTDDNGEKHAVCGEFNLIGFPYTSPVYYEDSTHESFTKMVVYSLGMSLTPNVMAIATRRDTSGTVYTDIVEIKRATSNTVTMKTMTTDFSQSYKDICQTSNSIVVLSVNRGSFLVETKIWKMEKPMNNFVLNSGHWTMTKMTDMNGRGAGLASSYGSKFYVYSDVVVNNVLVYEFDGLNYKEIGIGTNFLPSPVATYSQKLVGVYNSASDGLELLVDGKVSIMFPTTNTFPRNYIMHVPGEVFDTPDSIAARSSNSNCIITGLGDANAYGRFYAVGGKKSSGSLRLFKYKYDEWHNCFNQIKFDCDLKNTVLSNNNKNFGISTKTLTKKYSNVKVKYITPDKECE